MKRLNKTGLKGSPCGSPIFVTNVSVRNFPDRITNVKFLYIWSSKVQSSIGNPRVCSFIKRISRRTVSNAFEKSTKHTNVLFLLHRLLLITSQSNDAAETVVRFLRKPNCQVGNKLLISAKLAQAQPDMVGDLTHVVRLNWQDWAGHSSYVVK